MKYGLKVFIQHYKSKEHWYIKYLIWGIVIIVSCAILVHVFKKLGCTPARNIFGFFDDWATILSASVMLLLAGAAVWAIMDNRYARKVDRKERLLNEIIEWVSVLKLRTLQANRQITVLEKERGYEGLFFAISDELVKAELINLLASENSIPVENELNNVWQSAFFCSQLAGRMAGKKPTDEQRKSWSENALDIVARIDQLEEQGNLTGQEMYNGQKDLLEKVSLCLKKLAEVKATL